MLWLGLAVGLNLALAATDVWSMWARAKQLRGLRAENAELARAYASVLVLLCFVARGPGKAHTPDWLVEMADELIPPGTDAEFVASVRTTRRVD